MGPKNRPLASVFQLNKQKVNQKQETRRRTKESAFLLEEIKELKKELKSIRGYKMPRKLMKAKSTSTGKIYSSPKLEIIKVIIKITITFVESQMLSICPG